MVGWHHRLNGREFERTLGDSEKQGRLVCCSPWGPKSQTQLSNWTWTWFLLGWGVLHFKDDQKLSDSNKFAVGYLNTIFLLGSIYFQFRDPQNCNMPYNSLHKKHVEASLQAGPQWFPPSRIASPLLLARANYDTAEKTECDFQSAVIRNIMAALLLSWITGSRGSWLKHHENT